MKKIFTLIAIFISLSVSAQRVTVEVKINDTTSAEKKYVDSMNLVNKKYTDSLHAALKSYADSINPIIPVYIDTLTAGEKEYVDNSNIKAKIYIDSITTIYIPYKDTVTLARKQYVDSVSNSITDYVNLKTTSDTFNTGKTYVDSLNSVAKIYIDNLIAEAKRYTDSLHSTVPQTSNTGNDRGYVDSMNLLLNNYLTQQIQLMQEDFNAKLGSKIDTATPPAPSQYVSFYGNGRVIDIYPSNYNPALGIGRFGLTIQEFPGINGVGVRSNNVVRLGWNTNSGGGKEIGADHSFHDAWEQYYVIGGREVVERHVSAFHPRYSIPGVHEVRPWSYYGDINSGRGSIDMMVEQFNYKLVTDPAHDWFYGQVADKDARFNLMPKQGGQSSFTLNGKQAYGYPNQNTYSHSQLEVVTTGHLSGFYSTVPFVFNKRISVDGTIDTGSSWWKLGAVVDGNPTVIINNVTYKLAVVE